MANFGNFDMDLGDQRVLVTGGAGFIGSHLCSHLVDGGSDVCIIDNLAKGMDDYVPKAADFHQVDVLSDDLKSIVTEFDPTVVVHLAAIHFVPYCNDHPEETVDVNVIGFRNLLNGLDELSNLEYVLYTSSANVYQPQESPHQEDSSPVEPDGIYGKTKLIGEDLLKKFHLETGVPSVSVRTFNVYGSNETNPHLIPEIIEQIDSDTAELELGNLRPKRDFIHVSDVVSALVAVLNAGGEGYRTYNLGTGTEHSVQEVAEIICNHFGYEIQIVQESGRKRENDRYHLCADIQRARSELDWEPEITIQEGIDRLV
jgi:UDP-glucose 4-epimerase